MKIIALYILVFWGSITLSQNFGLPIWPFVTGSPEYLAAIDNLANTNISNYTPHMLYDWKSNQIKEIPNTAPSSGQDNAASAQIAFNHCEEPEFYLLHNGIATDVNAGEFFLPDGTKAIAAGASINMNKSDLSAHLIKRPFHVNQYFIIYTKQNDDAYSAEQVLYSIVEIKNRSLFFVEINGVKQKDISLKSPPVNNKQGNHLERYYIHAKAMSYPSVTIAENGFDLYLIRISDFSTGRPGNSSNKSHSIDRFEVSENGIIWTDNSGSITSYHWGLMVTGSDIEVSPDASKIAYSLRTDRDNQTEIFFSDITSGLTNNVERIKMSEVLIKPDMINSSITGYSPTTPSQYLTPTQLGSSNFYLGFLKNFERKIAYLEFSSNGNYLYYSAGGYVSANYASLSYLGQLDLNSNVNGKYTTSIQVIATDNWSQSTGRGNSFSGWKNNIDAQQRLLNNYNSSSDLQSSINGNIYFTRVRDNKCYVIPNPNSELTSNLIPSDIDLSTPNEPNLTMNGLLHSLPEQIDGYDYSAGTQYDHYEIPVKYMTYNNCDSVCDSLVISILKSDSSIIENFNLFDCQDTIRVCLPSNEIYNLKGGNNVQFNTVLLNGNVTYPTTNNEEFNFSIPSTSGCCKDTVNIINNDSTVCLGDTITLNLNPISSKGGKWSYEGNEISSEFIPQKLNENKIYHSINSNQNCISVDSVVITVLNYPDASILTPDTFLCESNPSLILNTVEAGGFWERSIPGLIDTNNFVKNLPAGDTWFYYNKKVGTCLSRDSIKISIISNDSIVLMDTLDVCVNQKESLFASQPKGLFYGDYVQNGNFESPTHGIYKVYYRIDGACPLIDSTIVNVKANQTIDFTIDSLTSCIPIEFEIEINNDEIIENYRLLNGYGEIQENLGKNISLTYDTDGLFYPQFELKETSPLESCFDSVVLIPEILIEEGPVANFTWNNSLAPLITNEPNYVDFQNLSKNADTWKWFFGRDIHPATSTEFEETVTYFSEVEKTIKLYLVAIDGECSDTIFKEIIFRDRFNFYIPNAFTPNGDLKNEYFKPKWNRISNEDYLFEVYNRWGELIFSTSNPETPWNGTHQKTNQEVQMDTYVWKINYKDIYSNKVNLDIGRVSLIR